MERWACPECSRRILPEDTFIFGPGRLGHLNCRRPRVLSAEERALLFVYCRDHDVAACSTCRARFRLLEISSPDQFGVRPYVCTWCHADLTDSIRGHLYGCAMLPAEVRRRVQAAREAARNLVKQGHRNRADVLMSEVEAALHSLREIMRQPLRKRSA
jgi:hypothetical protein